MKALEHFGAFGYFSEVGWCVLATLETRNVFSVFVSVGRVLRHFRNDFMDKIWQQFYKGDRLSKNMHDFGSMLVR